MFGLDGGALRGFVTIAYFSFAIAAAVLSILKARIYLVTAATMLSIAAAFAQYGLDNVISANKDRQFEKYKVAAKQELDEYKINATKEIEQAREGAAKANENAKKAEQNSAYASLEAADAKKQTAELERQAEILKANNLKLESQLSWRHLANYQRQDLKGFLGKLPRQPIKISSVAGDAEGNLYMQDFASVLREANSNFGENDVFVTSGASTPIGVHVYINLADRYIMNIAAPALALSGELYRLGIIPKHLVEA